MNDLQNQQNLHNEKLTNPYDGLDEPWKKAVDLRLKGLTHEAISMNLKKDKYKAEEQTVRSWFKRSGKCYRAYAYKLALRRKENKKEFTEIDFQIKQGAVDAIVVLRKAVATGNWKAALELLKLAGFTPVEKFQDVSESEGMQLLRKIIESHEPTHPTVQDQSAEDTADNGAAADI